MHGLSGEELLQYRLDVQYRCAVNRIDFTHPQRSAFNTYDLANRASDSVGTILRSLREDSNFGSRFVVPGMARSDHNLVLGHLVEDEKHLYV